MLQKKKGTVKNGPDQKNVKASTKDKFILSTEQSKWIKPLRFFLLFWHPVTKMVEIPGTDDIEVFMQQRLSIFYQLRPLLYGKDYHFYNDELLTVEKYLSSIHGHTGAIKQHEFLCLYKDHIIEKMNCSNIVTSCESLTQPALALMFFYLLWSNYFGPPDPDYYKNRAKALQAFRKDFKILAEKKFWTYFNKFQKEHDRITPKVTQSRKSINDHRNYFEKILPILQSKSQKAFDEAMKDYSRFKSRYLPNDETKYLV
jgi:hypothetical protein